MRGATAMVADPFTILIADDERASRDLLQRSLAAPGREIVTARDGDEAVALLEERPFDILLADLNMPRMGGEELFHRAIALRPEIQVIFITGYGSLETVLGAIQAGAYDFVAKPFKLAEIQLVVRNACDKVALMREVAALRRRESLPLEEVEPAAPSRPVTVAPPGAIGEYQRAAEGGWESADTRLALERIRAAGGLTEQELQSLEERVRARLGG
ncbi:MAG: response regulator [Nitrospirae bacterium]|nr:MAG: response regulator [Nitrospirota bacterium]